VRAAVRFEVRLGDPQPATGLTEAKVADSGDVIYLHPNLIVTNDDIAATRVMSGNTPSAFRVAVTFTATGAEKMRQATAGAVGKRLAILIDGEVVSAPLLRSVISASAEINGNYTGPEAERIADGMLNR
jgi:preprotein translocase subunit SecD